MFKCLNLQTKQEVVILSPAWRKRLDDVRSLDRGGFLVCPGCRQPVRLRAGRFRRWHFAHKHLANCPLANQSPELLHCRAVLYEWLLQHFEPQAVTLEKDIPGLPRPLDAWVQAGEGEFGYWIIDARLLPAVRAELRQHLEGQGLMVNWIFSSKLLHEDGPHPGWVHLTTTEREFLRTSSLDAAAEAAGEAPGMSITYLDPGAATFTTYRSLKLRHPPQLYSGRRSGEPFHAISPHPATGECLYPGDPETLWRFQQKAELVSRRAQKSRAFFNAHFNSPETSSASFGPTQPGTPDLPGQITPRRPAAISPEQALVRQPFARAGICKICGKTTTDWVTYFSKTGECICRDCQG
jgi:hypothetical protein